MPCSNERLKAYEATQKAFRFEILTVLISALYDLQIFRALNLLMQTGAFLQLSLTLTAVVSRSGVLFLEMKETVDELLDALTPLLAALRVSEFSLIRPLPIQHPDRPGQSALKCYQPQMLCVPPCPNSL